MYWYAVTIGSFAALLLVVNAIAALEGYDATIALLLGLTLCSVLLSVPKYVERFTLRRRRRQAARAYQEYLMHREGVIREALDRVSGFLNLSRQDASPTDLLIAIADENPEAAIHWAWQRVESGLESGSLLILATLSPPHDTLEVSSYLKRTLHELDIVPPPREDILIWYALALAQRLIESPDSPAVEFEGTLKRIESVCIDLEYPGELVALADLAGQSPSEPNQSGWFASEAAWRTAVLSEATSVACLGAKRAGV